MELRQGWMCCQLNAHWPAKLPVHHDRGGLVQISVRPTAPVFAIGKTVGKGNEIGPAILAKYDSRFRCCRIVSWIPILRAPFNIVSTVFGADFGMQYSEDRK